jgi:chromosome segregation ATPase
MIVETQTPKNRNAEKLQASRDDVNSLQFFVTAMLAQLQELHDKLAQVEMAATYGEQASQVMHVETERDAAAREVESLRAQLQDAERVIAGLKQELERQQVTFADHHAAKQEIARLRAELDSDREPEDQGEEKKGSRLFRR